MTWTTNVTPPTVTVTGTTPILGCNPAAADIIAAFGAPSATDNCGGSDAVTTNLSAVTVSGCTATQSCTFSATDACGGNTASQTKTVTWTTNVTPPTVTVTGTTPILGCNPAAADIIAAFGAPSATDNCGGSDAVTTNLSAVTVNGCTATQSCTFSATDACGGNTASQTKTVTWTTNVTPPTVTVTGTTPILGCNPAAADIIAAFGTPSATDNCGGSDAVTTNLSAVTVSGCTATQSCTFSATDACGGNTASQTKTVTWTTNVTPPTITVTGTTPILGCNPTAADIIAAFGTPSATDNCGGSDAVTTNLSAVTVSGCTATQTCTFSATDNCGGNTALHLHHGDLDHQHDAPDDHGERLHPVSGLQPSGGGHHCGIRRALCHGSLRRQ